MSRHEPEASATVRPSRMAGPPSTLRAETVTIAPSSAVPKNVGCWTNVMPSESEMPESLDGSSRPFSSSSSGASSMMAIVPDSAVLPPAEVIVTRTANWPSSS